MLIETIEAWNNLLPLLTDCGYTVWQMQHSIDTPDGFHATFWASGHPLVEIVTHSRAVHDLILGFKSF